MARYTGFSPETKELIAARSSGMCEVMQPGCTQFGEQIHHRRPRGLGGSRRASTNTASNGLMVCVSCHAYIESRRDRSLRNGWLVPQSREPRQVAVLWRVKHSRFLDDVGGFTAPAEEVAS